MNRAPCSHQLRSAAPARQRGAALLLAMLIVTLVTTLAAATVWQQWRAVQVEAAERGRVQAAWILAGGLDWARLILREDARSNSSNSIDHLGEPWAVPLAEARLSTFLSADQNNTDDAPEAFLSGSIEDAQARYNLLRLLVQNRSGIDPAEVLVLQRLFGHIGVDASEAPRIATQLLQALAPAGSEGLDSSRPLAPTTLSQLRWLAVADSDIEKMRRYVVLLPERTQVNINTAPREVLAAVGEGLDLAGAERLVQARQQNPFRDTASAQVLLGGNLSFSSDRAGVSSRFFEVRGRLRLGERQMEEWTLVQRRSLEIVTLAHERIQLDQPAR